LKVTKEHGLKERIEDVAKLLKSVSKASSFDMTLMFMDTKERNDLKEIMKAINDSKEIERDLVKDLNKIYNL